MTHPESKIIIKPRRLNAARRDTVERGGRERSDRRKGKTPVWVFPSEVILGIDPGVADTGWGVIRSRGSTLSLVDSGCIKTPRGQEHAQRLGTIYRTITRILVRHRPTRAAVERLFFSRNVKTALAVGEARGVVLLALGQRGVPYVEPTPVAVKQAVTGWGGAEKLQVQKMVKRLLHLSAIPDSDDTADALAVALCATATRRTS